MRAYIITTADSKHVGRKVDWQLVNMQRRYMAYAPLGFIAYQQDGFSLLWQKRREWGDAIHHFYYIGMDGKLYYY